MRRTLLGAVLFSGVAVAQEPEAETTQTEATQPETTQTEAPAAPAEAPVASTEDVRETWDSAGRLTRRLVLDDGRLVEEIANAYDADGRLASRTTTSDGRTTVETWTYDADGYALTHETLVDGQRTALETMTWADGRMATLTLEQDGRVETTTWTYDDEGQAVLVETRAADGTVLRRVISERAEAPPERVPIKLALSGGVATDSDVRTTSVSGGFEISRKPDPGQYDEDPLEVSAYGSYTLGVSEGERTNDDLKAGFGLDYNEFVDRTTAFLFTRVERNPVANLDIDLELAPIGIKYEIVPEGGVFSLDASFAPIWNFRSILVEAGSDCEDVVVEQDTHCTFNKVRGSFRVRAALVVGGLTLKDTIEFQPTLNPASGNIVAGLQEEGIFRNTAALSVALTDRLSLKSSVVFTRDPLLAEQADCDADPENLLCDGLSLESASTLGLALSF